MQETTNTPGTEPDEKITQSERTIKKQWIKPEAGILNVNSGGGTIVDGPDTRFSPIS